MWGGGRFSWSNNQIDPTMSLLDRVLVSAEWENLFPLSLVKLETRLGSDHSPLVISLGENYNKRPKRFYMERQWFSQEGFLDFVTDKWRHLILTYSRDGTAVDCWNFCVRGMRKSMKGWGANWNREARLKKEKLLNQI